jgi:hypothetical protein
MAQIEETRYAPELKRHWPLGVLAATLALGMFVLAAYGVHETRAPFGNGMLRFICGGLPTLLGVSILFSMVGVYQAYSKLVILMRRDNFTYEMGGKVFRRRWRDVTLTRPDPSNKSFFSSALLSDGQSFFRLYRFVYLHFDQLMEDIDRERLSGRGAHNL